jgi:glycosyltransferase involved in cell wall biosynthesis
MKILLSSHFFHPSVGGIEEVSRVLVAEFARAGHEVRVVTTTREEDGAEFPFEIVRRPGPARLLALVRWCDVFFHNNISLQAAWPLLLARRPWVVAHHTWIARTDGRRGLRDRLKLRLLRRARNISISNAIAGHLGVPSRVIGDPYDGVVFKTDPHTVRDGDLIFVGRLVSDKGAALLLDALHLLKAKGVARTLTLVGDGPERAVLQARAVGLDVRFVGVLRGCELAVQLNRHCVLVVPSLWNEPFGIVALEGIACGCAVVGSAGGGLPDAIGPCGVTFPNGDAAALADCLSRELPMDEFRRAAPAHLTRYRAAVVARAYLEVFEEALG